MTAEAEGNAEIQDAPEDVQELEARKPNKFEQKRQKILAERIQRKIAKGMSPDNAVASIQREDYEALPDSDKIKRLESAMIHNFQRLAGDINTLKSNQDQLADIMDVNFRAFEKMLLKLGIPLQEQLDTMTLVAEEIKTEREARAVAKQVEEEEAKKASLVDSVDQSGTPEVPEGATVFGN